MWFDRVEMGRQRTTKQCRSPIRSTPPDLPSQWMDQCARALTCEAVSRSQPHTLIGCKPGPPVNEKKVAGCWPWSWCCVTGKLVQTVKHGPPALQLSFLSSSCAFTPSAPLLFRCRRLSDASVAGFFLSYRGPVRGRVSCGGRYGMRGPPRRAVSVPGGSAGLLYPFGSSSLDATIHASPAVAGFAFGN